MWCYEESFLPQCFLKGKCTLSLRFLHCALCLGEHKDGGDDHVSCHCGRPREVGVGWGEFLLKAIRCPALHRRPFLIAEEKGPLKLGMLSTACKGAPGGDYHWDCFWEYLFFLSPPSFLATRPFKPSNTEPRRLRSPPLQMPQPVATSSSPVGCMCVTIRKAESDITPGR